ncbi:MAG TPA: hypothetical protein VKT80_17015 [Chloroflexota bacterium]|nr:hypothetical protein [Chloroflexota bacterium]
MSLTQRSDPRQDEEVVVVDNPPARNNVEHVDVHTHDSSGLERHEQVVRDASGLEEHHEEQVANHGAERWLALSKASQVVQLVIGVIEGVIALRVVLKLIAANPQNAFANLVYGVSGIFVDPFYTLTASPRAGGVVLEIPSLIAMIVYALVGWAIVKIIYIVLAPSRSRSQSTYDRYRA